MYRSVELIYKKITKYLDFDEFYTNAGFNVATCGAANATGFGLLATNFSHVVASLATAISSYFF